MFFGGEWLLSECSCCRSVVVTEWIVMRSLSESGCWQRVVVVGVRLFSECGLFGAEWLLSECGVSQSVVAFFVGGWGLSECGCCQSAIVVRVVVGVWLSECGWSVVVVREL